MTKNLILVGGGGHCKSVIDAACSAGFHILGVLDTLENIGKSILDVKIIGDDSLINEYIGSAMFVVTVGSIKKTALRIKLHNMIIDAGGRLATIVASTAHVSKYATIDEGSVILHNTCINADARIGKSCIINTFANIEHEAEIGDFSHISTGAMVNGACKIGKSVFIGSQSVLAQCVSVADYAIVSAGTFVSKNIQEKGIYAGNPMRKF
ncbi:MAG: NeuD/PglB/VioB family sugar acetyltransferase [Prevotella sp.]|jgi:sugar O-acyltransferase (sialic acid O-acetyltransferase NeuD family)|nr:NeuD/PglB/VioB family sugar acetyltransferase [Prevotella sp.]